MANTAERKERAPYGQGPNLEPLKELLEAESINVRYKDPPARRATAEKLSRALGIEKPSAFLKDNLDKALDNESMLSDLTLRAVLAETRKRRV